MELKTEIARQYDIAPSSLTMINWIKSDAILSASENYEISPARKKIRLAKHQDVEKVLYEWFKLSRSKNIPISDHINVESWL